KTKWKLSLTDVLSIVFILLILLDPYIVYHIGFQFSFLVTFGLLISRKWISQSKSSFFAILQISFVSQMMILPLQLAYFYNFQPLSIVIYTAVVPYFSLFVIPFMFFMLVTSALPFVSGLLDMIFVPIHEAFLRVMGMMDQFAYAPFVMGPLPFASAAIYYVLFVGMMHQLQKEKAVQAFKYG